MLRDSGFSGPSTRGGREGAIPAITTAVLKSEQERLQKKKIVDHSNGFISPSRRRGFWSPSRRVAKSSPKSQTWRGNGELPANCLNPSVAGGACACPWGRVSQWRSVEVLDRTA